MGDLGAIGDVQQTWTQLQDQLPSWLNMLAVVMLGWGFVLWLFGKRFIRPSLTLIGLAGGALLGVQIGKAVDAGPAVGWAIGGALVGGVVAYLAFRIWMALLLGLALGVMVPWGVAAWHGEPPPTMSPTGEQIGERIREQIDEVVPTGPTDVDAEVDADTNVDDSSAAGAEAPPWQNQMSDVLSEMTAAWRGWWGELSGVMRSLVITGAGIGGLGGFVLGMMLPTLAASLMASFTGVLLLVSALSKLIPAWAPGLADDIPSGPRASLVLIVVATVIGAAFQWTMRRRSADK